MIFFFMYFQLGWAETLFYDHGLHLGSNVAFENKWASMARLDQASNSEHPLSFSKCASMWHTPIGSTLIPYPTIMNVGRERRSSLGLLCISTG